MVVKTDIRVREATVDTSCEQLAAPNSAVKLVINEMATLNY